MIESTVRNLSNASGMRKYDKLECNITSAQLDRLKNAVYQKTGLQLSMFKDCYLLKHFSEFMDKHQIVSPDALVEKISNLQSNCKDKYGVLHPIRNEFIKDLSEILPGRATRFFRDPFVFVKIIDEITTLPHHDKYKILCAGSGSGEEPYSIALALYSKSENARDNIEIKAIELSPFLIETARRAKYATCNIKQIPDEYYNKVMISKGNTYFTMDKEILESVVFIDANLTSEKLLENYKNYFDLIALRYVVVFLKPEYTTKIIRNVSKMLNTCGRLWLGVGEFIEEPEQFSLELVEASVYRRI
jgi:chemotaxis methyl-accepting protein methylase